MTPIDMVRKLAELQEPMEHLFQQWGIMLIIETPMILAGALGAGAMYYHMVEKHLYYMLITRNR
jgi:hypothetical protein